MVIPPGGKQPEKEPPGGRLPACSERLSPSGISAQQICLTNRISFEAGAAPSPALVNMVVRTLQMATGGFDVCLIYPTYFMPLSSVLVQPSKNVLPPLKSAVRSA